MSNRRDDECMETTREILTGLADEFLRLAGINASMAQGAMEGAQKVAFETRYSTYNAAASRVLSILEGM